jgi:hypothetical protein
LARLLCSGLLGWALAIFVMISAAPTPAVAQQGFDRPGGDYLRFVVPSADPAVCSARCDRDNRCRAWTFAYPNTAGSGGANAARGLPEGLRGGEPLPRLDLRAAGLRGRCRALLSQGQDHAAAAQAVLRLRRGAVRLIRCP